MNFYVQCAGFFTCWFCRAQLPAKHPTLLPGCAPPLAQKEARWPAKRSLLEAVYVSQNHSWTPGGFPSTASPLLGSYRWQHSKGCMFIFNPILTIKVIFCQTTVIWSSETIMSVWNIFLKLNKNKSCVYICTSADLVQNTICTKTTKTIVASNVTAFWWRNVDGSIYYLQREMSCERRDFITCCERCLLCILWGKYLTFD